jgi:hypothetical protein
MAPVADVTATASREPTNCANFCSNSAHFDPVVIHPERSTSVTARMSRLSMVGWLKGKKSFRMAFSAIWDINPDCGIANWSCKNRENTTACQPVID